MDYSKTEKEECLKYARCDSFHLKEKKVMKKFISASVAILMAWACTACSGGSNTSSVQLESQFVSSQADNEISASSEVTPSESAVSSGDVTASESSSTAAIASGKAEQTSQAAVPSTSSKAPATSSSSSDSGQQPENTKGLIAAFALNKGSGNTITAQNDAGFISSPVTMSKDGKTWVRWDKDAKMGNFMHFLRYESAANFYAGGLVQVKSKPIVIGSENAPFSISAWINPSEYQVDDTNSHDFRVIFAKGGNETLAHWDFKLLKDNRLSFYAHAMASADRKDSPYVVPNNKWTHVMVACTGKRMIYYANGKEVYAYDLTSDYDIISQPTGAYSIGGLIENVYGFCGGIAEVKIYNQAVKPEDTTDRPFN